MTHKIFTVLVYYRYPTKSKLTKNIFKKSISISKKRILYILYCTYTEISFLFDKHSNALCVRKGLIGSISVFYSCNTIMISYSFGGKVYVYYSETRDYLVRMLNATACSPIHSVLQVTNYKIFKILNVTSYNILLEINMYIFCKSIIISYKQL